MHGDLGSREVSVLEPHQCRVPVSVISLIAIKGFQHASSLQIKTCIELIGHSYTAMYLDQLIGHFVEEIPDFDHRHRAQLGCIFFLVIYCL